MPFDVGAAAAHVRRVVIKFNDETLTIRYNAGAKFKDYQQLSQKLQREFSDLQYELGRTARDENAGADDAYEKLSKRLETTRRELANNICTVIESWDLEGDRDYIRSLMPEKEQKRNKDITGQGEIPIDGAWLDALPLPDEFIEKIVEKIGESFSKGASGGKAS